MDEGLVKLPLLCFVQTEQRTTVQGQVYFLHTQTGVSTWHDPRIPRYAGACAPPVRSTHTWAERLRRAVLWLMMLICWFASLLLGQGSGQCELRGVRTITGGLGGSEHSVGPDLLCGPQQQNHPVHRPTPAHHHQVQVAAGNRLCWKPHGSRADSEAVTWWTQLLRGVFFFSSQQSQVKESSQAPPMDVGGDDTGNGGVGGGGGEGDVAARYERDLVHKLKLLRHELALQQPQAGHCRIEVSREEIFEVGTEAAASAGEIAAVLSCWFSLRVNAGVISADHEDEAQRPEEASDGEVQGRGGSGLWGGGQVMTPGEVRNIHCNIWGPKPSVWVRRHCCGNLCCCERGMSVDHVVVCREWLYLLCHEMLNPYYGLFQYSTDNIYTLQINPDSSINPVSTRTCTHR